MRSLTLRHAGALLIAGALAIAGCSGDKGSDGKSCSVQDNGDNTATISCSDGTSVTVNDGVDGVDGNPASCTITPNADGTKTITCSDGTSIVVRDAVVDFAAMTAEDKADLDPNIVVTGVTIPADGKPVVHFRVSDRHGNGVKGIIEAASTARIAMLKLAPPGVNVSANETWINYIASSPTSTSSYETPTTSGAVLSAGGDGTYTFKFAKNVTAGTGALAYDANLVHRVVFIAYQSGNPYAPMNVVFDFIPATGVVKNPNDSESVDGAACLQCHGRFRAKAGEPGGFHGGARYDVRGCVMCHNDQRRFTTISGNSQNDAFVDPTGAWTGNLAVVNGEGFINLPVFIHKIHMGEHLTLDGGRYPGFQPGHVTYPQDVRNCTKCHKTNAKAANWKNAPSRRACGACHDDINFSSTPLNARRAHSGGARDTDLTTVSPAYVGCNGCHAPAAIEGYHSPVALPNPENYFVSTTMSSNVQAGWMPGAGKMPAGAIEIAYDVSSVTTVAAAGGGWNPQMKFKFKKRGPHPTTDAFVDVVFNATTASSEIMDNFVNSPSVYFVFAVSQDGIAAPADWNASINATIKNLWRGTGGTLSATPDGSGYYTATIKNAKVPASATLLTGGVGYSYSLSSSPPLTQTNVAGFPYNSNASTDVICGPGQAVACVGATAASPITLKPKMGGLVVTAPNVWKTASGHAARRTIVSNAKCNACHEQIGVLPSFHAGQRNDAPTCAFCHTPNRTSSGWSANTKDFVHGIHGAGKREVPFNWHAAAPDHGFFSITYPGILNLCTQCHVDPTSSGNTTYDFSANESAIENLLPSTVATGKFDPANASSFAYSPYVVVDNTTDYGSGFSFTGSSGTWVDPSLSTTGLRTLITSPITAACVSCHDTDLAKGHMSQFGGVFYEARSTGLGYSEQCLMCHGKGKVAAIQDVHLKR